jgi:hypothetical protein
MNLLLAAYVILKGHMHNDSGFILLAISCGACCQRRRCIQHIPLQFWPTDNEDHAAQPTFCNIQEKCRSCMQSDVTILLLVITALLVAP